MNVTWNSQQQFWS